MSGNLTTLEGKEVWRAVDAVKRGELVRISGAECEITASALELATTLQPNSQLLITAERAKYLGLNPGTAPLLCLSLDRAEADTIQQLLYGDTPVKVKQTQAVDDPLYRSAMALVKEAGLLPAAVIATTQHARDSYTPRLRDSDILQVLAAAPQLSETTPSPIRLPLKYAEHTQVRMFREIGSGVTHLAILVGEAAEKAPLVRVHSSCFTGDLLGSLRCDCGEQLHSALERMNEAGSGLLLYLNQEGRGIGLAHKLRAYGLQDRGYDTVDANEMLGFKPDERDFRVAASLLKQLGMSTITLLSNNPAKRDALAREGIQVTAMQPLVVAKNPHNEAYLSTKAKKLKHHF